MPGFRNSAPAVSPPALPTTVPSGPRVHRLHAIEVARGLASGWVLLFHSLATWPPESLHPLLRLVQRFTAHGWLGVHMFFAISGWCIAERLAAAHRRGESCGVFLRERALRIFPTYWVAVALLLVVRLLALPFNHAPLEQNFPMGARAWLGDILLINPYLGVPAILIVSWSLVFELGFYALGAGALLLRRRGLGSAAIIALGLLVCVWPLLRWNFRATYVLSLWPDFFAGALVWWCARAPSPARVATSVGALVTLGALTAALPGGYGNTGRCTALVTATALWILSRHDRAATAAAPWRVLAWVGGYSYSLYLAHLTIVSPFMNLAQRVIAPRRAAFIAVWVATLALGLAAGWLLHRFIEAPVERWRKRRWGFRPAPAIL